MLLVLHIIRLFQFNQGKTLVQDKEDLASLISTCHSMTSLMGTSLFDDVADPLTFADKNVAPSIFNLVSIPF